MIHVMYLFNRASHIYKSASKDLPKNFSLWVQDWDTRCLNNIYNRFYNDNQMQLSMTGLGLKQVPSNTGSNSPSLLEMAIYYDRMMT